MKFIARLILVLGFAGPLVAQEAGKQAEPSPRQLLQKATIFGFGVKDGQAPDARATDVAYRTLMVREDARQQFVQIFEKGDLYGKCYALCAMHDLDKKLFAKWRATLNLKQVVSVRNGCVYEDMTVKKIVSAIEDGRYAFMNKGQ